MYTRYNASDYYFANGGQKKGWLDKINDHPISQVVKILDPTGITSWKDAYNSWTDGKLDADDFLAALSVIPMVGRIGKGASLASKAYKFIKGTNTAKKLLTTANKLAKTSKIANGVVQGSKVAGKLAGNIGVGYAKYATAAALNPTAAMYYLSKGVASGVGSMAKGLVKGGGKTTIKALNKLGLRGTAADLAKMGTKAGNVTRKATHIMNAPSRVMARGVEKVFGNGVVGNAARSAINLGLGTARFHYGNRGNDGMLKLAHDGVEAASPYIDAGRRLIDSDYNRARTYEEDTTAAQNIMDQYVASRTKDTRFRGGDEDVMNIQRQLNAELHARGATNHYLREDGYFGPKTEAVYNMLEQLKQQEQQTGVFQRMN